ncbi:HAE1 family hydrophobic/amphiphilic exporter-1 [Dyadobacter sp. BE34]|uniref:HAE1 family hydrophobic/amphiphilic exporter-1 n=1 Tax=Dyadobacter fermentans TaxID=94254 RepID=A0ABU1R1K3_9BACT|nr:MULTISPECIES: efflux RND transporter permease subunit [Dyadobacter]MDR6807281.1 HAE1 family hydrophobic/amphiphilic exporter-1 [Dyadobacter fermentans]MDR7045022.1 HAE1 family hydrophobic/amphiphilic exporter-1 [Dyadobacter sp. BE242]MDR7199242.1 HAE1 family hydrophobic/amphiphilic exporter-1 [Dyadobacter sp. BE34]MDR7217202.1 HAE1 family hydrophobic/amphiphilic exporter-1 [Dyadobacter sp. BE31]MDR7265135.1 HAE1 family hydrophobic/amphiphilic exporter-1 [Dyadobacter sp. BE32]
MKFIETILKRPSMIIVLFAILFIGGLASYTQLSYVLLPEFSVPTITITTLYPGAAPTEVEAEVSKKIEDAVSGLDNIEDVTSKSMESASLVIVQFKAGTDIDKALEDAQRDVNNMLSDLPDDAETPSLSKISPSDQPIMQLLATSSLPNEVFYQQVEDKYLPMLQQIEGVAEITMTGGDQREIRINVNNDKLRFYGLSLLQVTQAINQANLDFPTGKVKSTSENMTLRLAGKFASLDDIRNLVITSPVNNSPIRVGDVADITDGLTDAESISRYNGVNGIGLFIKKQSDANAVEISKSVQAKLASIEKANAKDKIKFAIAYDSSIFTLESVEAVTHDLVIAVILVAVVMLLFLHSFRNAFIVMVSVPASLIAAFLFMYVMGYSLNLMTLLALSLVIGILVDDSIVILENIQRHLEMGKNRWDATVEGVTEIGFAALAITLVIVVVFVPITMVNSVIADLLRQFSLTVAFATMVSLLVSFTLTPWMTSNMAKVERLNPKNPAQAFLIWFEKGLTALTKWYHGSLEWVLGHKLAFSGILVAIVVMTGWVMSLGIIGSEFVAEGDQGKFLLTMKLDKSASLQQNNLTARSIEDYLRKKPEVKTIFANVGGASTGLNSSGRGETNRTELTVELIPVKERKNEQPTEDYMLAVRKELEQKFAGVEFNSAAIGMVNSGTAPIEVFLSGDNLEKILAAANDLANRLRKTPGANDVNVSVEAGNPEVRVDIDREKMAKLGLDIQTVGATMQNAFAGNDDSKFRDGGEDYDIRVMLDAFDRKNPEDVKAITFYSPVAKQSVQLAQFADVTLSTGPSIVERKNRRSSVTVTANTLGIGSGTLVSNIQAGLKENPLPDDIILTWGGDAKNQSEGFGSLGLAMLAGLMLVYFIMVLLYDSFVYPFVVLFSIPVAVIGALLALALSSSNIGIFAMLGMLMLIGLVVKNAILIVDFANQQKAEGVPFRKAILIAGEERLRPILMTTIAMVIGMVPIATATGAGAEWKNSLAWVLIGGLTSSMLLTIYLVPMAYYLVDRLGEKWNTWRAKSARVQESVVVEEI